MSTHVDELDSEGGPHRYDPLATRESTPGSSKWYGGSPKDAMGENVAPETSTTITGSTGKPRDGKNLR